MSFFYSHYLELNNNDLESGSFVKRLVLVFCGIGQQLVSLSNIKDISTESWTQYLRVMLSLFSHQNLIFNAMSVQFWFVCLKQHNEFSNNKPFDKSLLMSILSLIPLKLLRQDYNKLMLGFEFDNSDDYETFYIKFRSDTIDLLRQITGNSFLNLDKDLSLFLLNHILIVLVLDENMCFKFVSESLNTALMQSNNNRTDWEILAQLSAAVYNKITHINEVLICITRLICGVSESQSKADSILILC